jgi:hypothetical protein
MMDRIMKVQRQRVANMTPSFIIQWKTRTILPLPNFLYATEKNNKWAGSPLYSHRETRNEYTRANSQGPKRCWQSRNQRVTDIPAILLSGARISHSPCRRLLARVLKCASRCTARVERSCRPTPHRRNQCPPLSPRRLPLTERSTRHERQLLGMY